jgi:hypothetical protein
MDRFHIVVFNYSRIGSFLDNFARISHFDPARDRIVILDCSPDQERERELVARFTAGRGWRAEAVSFVPRRNWGIDQGARIDYFSGLHQTSDRPKYIWQFQEHFLDLDSAASRWPAGTVDLSGAEIGGRVKEDTIPEGAVIDLDECERIFEADPAVAVLFAARGGVGLFALDDQEWFYTDGGNCAVRTAAALAAFPEPKLAAYRDLHDGTYEWALYFELSLGRELTRGDFAWYDLVARCSFNGPGALREVERQSGRRLHHDAEPAYRPLYRGYERIRTAGRWRRPAARGRLSVERFLRKLASLRR